jgi:hypothetical protein
MAGATVDRHEFFTCSGRYHSTVTDRKGERVQLYSLPVLSL